MPGYVSFPESLVHFIPRLTYPFLIFYDVVTAKLFGQVWSQDVEAATELGEHHVVWITYDKKCECDSFSRGMQTW